MTALAPQPDAHAPRLSLLPYGALLVAMISLAGGTSFAKGLFPAIGAEGATAYRVTLAAVVLMALWRPWRFRFSRRDWIGMAIYGSMIGALNLCFYLSLRTIPLGIALAIEFAGPLTLALLSARRPIHAVWVALAAIGLLMLLPLNGGAGALDPIGVALAALAGVFWALYIVFAKRLSHIHPGHSVALGMTMAAVLVLPIGVAHAGMALLSPPIVLAGIVVALASSAVPYSLDMYAMRHIPKRTFGVLLSAEPAIGALAGIIVLHEMLTGQQWLAIGAIMAASAGAMATTRPGDGREDARTPEPAAQPSA